MKCKNCGTEFMTGIFCPECGTKNIDEEQIEKEKAEAERKAKEKAEQERIEKEKAEAEARAAKERALIEKAEKEKRELSVRTYKNVVYSNEAEARLAREEDDKIESLKQKLLTTKDQKVRQQMFSEFRDSIQTTEAKKRYELLKSKVDQEKPKAIKFNLIYGISIIVAIIVTAVLGVTGLLDGVWELVIGLAGLWYGIGIPVWIVWKIVLFVQSRGKNYYLNIEHI